MHFSRLILLILLLASASGWAEEGKPRDIEFEADLVDYDDTQKRIRLVGNVVITSEGSKLTAP